MPYCCQFVKVLIVVEANWKCWKLDLSTEPCSRRGTDCEQTVDGLIQTSHMIEVSERVLNFLLCAGYQRKKERLMFRGLCAYNYYFHYYCSSSAK